MEKDIERKINTILKILSKAKEPVGASLISRSLKDYGIELSERAVRYHLKIMDERGFTKPAGREGRLITPRGLEELENALVSDKVGLVNAKIDTLSYLTTFNPEAKKGKIVLNISFIPTEDFERACKAMKPVFEGKFCISDKVIVAFPGETLGDIDVPKDKVAFGTVCSVTLNGVLLKAGIPVHSRFGGILEIKEGKPLRFTELITYEGTTLDPLEIFIRSKMTSILKVAKEGEGKILASFREIASVSKDKVVEVLGKLKEAGIKGVIKMGKPSQPLCEVEVGRERIGMVTAGGLNPLATLEEVGIEAENKAMTTMVDFEELVSFSEVFSVQREKVKN